MVELFYTGLIIKETHDDLIYIMNTSHVRLFGILNII
jgi:hypothetical protein